MADTAPPAPLSQEEGIAIPLAVVGHMVLVAALVFTNSTESPPPPPERMEVTISDEAALISTSPEPDADPAADTGPVVGDMAPPPAPEPVEVARAEPLPQPLPKPVVTPPRPAPVARPLVQPKPQPKPVVKPAAQPKPAARPQTQQRPGTKPGNSRFGELFGNGIPAGKPNGKSQNAPAQASGEQKSAWKSLIGSKVLGAWNSCKVSGLDIEQLYADVSFVLATDGSILSIADPVIGGITPANRPQVAPFKACVVRSIKLAAPFRGLPPEYYNDWKSRNLRLRKKEQ